MPHLVICSLLLIVLGAHAQYQVPKAEFKVFSPRGFQVSIPAEEGATLFAFHGKLNEEMDGLEAGRWAQDVMNIKNGRFTFEDRETSFKPGDTVYYWTYVIYNGLGYREDNGIYVVSTFATRDNVPATTTPGTFPQPVTSTAPTLVETETAMSPSENTTNIIKDDTNRSSSRANVTTTNSVASIITFVLVSLLLKY